MGEEKIDLVVSGINPGANMGNDVFISGTVGAALQAFFRGIPSIAVSVTALRDVHFAPAAGLIRQVAQAVSRELLKPPLLLNINVPNVPQEKLKGVSLTRLGQRTYMDVVKEEDNGRRKFYWITRESPGWVLEKGLDVWTIRRRRVSITPIHTDLTAFARTKEVRRVTRDIRASLTSSPLAGGRLRWGVNHVDGAPRSSPPILAFPPQVGRDLASDSGLWAGRRR